MDHDDDPLEFEVTSMARGAWYEFTEWLWATFAPKSYEREMLRRWSVFLQRLRSDSERAVARAEESRIINGE
jgi:hypothetical protein